MNNYLKAEFCAKGINEGLARIIAAGFIMPLDPTLEQLADIKTAVSEAVTNSIIHGYGETDGKIILEFEIKNRVLHIKAQDFGVGIADIEQARMPMFTSKPEKDRSGMGFTVMESFMDSLHVISEQNAGTTVVMTKKL